MLSVVMPAVVAAMSLSMISTAASAPVRQTNQSEAPDRMAASAALYEKARKAAKCGDGKTASKLFLKAAKQGYAPAQYELALCYESCYGVSGNIAKARKWLEKAAEQKYGPAEYKIGFEHANGSFLYPLDYDETYALTRKWYLKAAEHGSAPAQRMLGLWYRNGFNCSQNLTKAIDSFSKAAEQSDWFACASLSDIYERGEGGIPADAAKAKKYHDMMLKAKAREAEDYRKAAECGDVRAMYELASCYESGLGVPQDEDKAREFLQKAAEKGYAPAQAEFASKYCRESKDRAEAAEWWRKAAEQGHVGAVLVLACCYERGDGVPKDSTKATEYRTRAAEQGFERAMRELGETYRHQKNMAEAVKWFSKVAKKDGYSAYQLGLCYQEGWEDAPPNMAKAAECFKMGAELDNALAQINLAKMYLAGGELAKDEAKAVELLKKASERGYPEAEYELGCCYRDGIGVPKDIAGARKSFEVAAQRGNEKAKAALEHLGQ